MLRLLLFNNTFGTNLLDQILRSLTCRVSCIPLLGIINKVIFMPKKHIKANVGYLFKVSHPLHNFQIWFQVTTPILFCLYQRARYTICVLSENYTDILSVYRAFPISFTHSFFCNVINVLEQKITFCWPYVSFLYDLGR